MPPCLILATANAVTRRRAQAALMDAGGRLGFHWTLERLPNGGAVLAVQDAPREARHELRRTVLDYLCVDDRPYEGWLMSRWGKPFTTADMDQIQGWFLPEQALRAATTWVYS